MKRRRDNRESIHHNEPQTIIRTVDLREGWSNADYKPYDKDDPLLAASQKAKRYTCSVDIGNDYTEEERKFMFAVDAYKKKYKRPFPTSSEVLAVLKSLGYSKNISIDIYS